MTWRLQLLHFRRIAAPRPRQGHHNGAAAAPMPGAGAAGRRQLTKDNSPHPDSGQGAGINQKPENQGRIIPINN
jgi:hypothetical protein